MAVLKRGDLAERWQLAASRKFAASFALAMKLWIKHFGAFLRLMWLPCLLSVVIGLVWLWLRPSPILWGVSIGCIVADFLGGAALLFMWSMMRIMQLKALDDMESGAKVEPMGFVRNFVAIVQRTWRPWLPLLAAWLVVVLLWRVPIYFGANIYVKLACIAVAIVLPFSVGGMIQSYMEVKAVPLLGRMRKGLKLNRRYWGGMAALWVISLLIIAVTAAVLLFGLVILQYAFANRDAAVAQEEEILVPAFVSWIQIGVFAVAVWLLSFVQSVWSLPQQVHIRSIIHKTLNK